MNADFDNMQVGDYVMIASTVEIEDNAKLYTRGEYTWIFISDFSGATGIQGQQGPQGEQGIQGPQGIQGIQGIQGETGNGIASVVKTSTVGLVDTYTITYTNGNTTTFDVTNGQDGDVTEAQLQDVYDQMSSEMETATKTGESIDTDDSAYWRCGITPKGQTEQVQYQGINIFDGEVETGNYNATTGEKTAGSNYRSVNYTSVSANETYIFSINGVGKAINVLEYQSDKTYIGNTIIPAGNSFTTSANCAYINIFSGAGDGNEKWQIEKGSTIHDYEPFVGGTASPNPSYPQTIHTVSGSNNVKVENKNLFGGFYGTRTQNTVDWEMFSDGRITANGTATSQSVSIGLSDAISTGLRVLQAGEYELSFTKEGTFTSGRIQVMEVVDGNASVLEYSTGNSRTFTITEPKLVYYRAILSTGGVAENAILYPLLEKKSIATSSYIPHAEQNYSITLPNGMELCKIGDYQDYIYKNNGNWYKKSYSKKEILDGNNSQTVGYSNILSAILYTNSNIANVTSTSTTGMVLCNKLPNVARNNFSSSTMGICINDTSNRVLLKFDGVTSYNTEAKVREYLSSNNYEILYLLATPVEEQITDTTLINQLNQIEKAKTYHEATHITQTNADLPFILTLDYKKSNLLRIKALENA